MPWPGAAESLRALFASQPSADAEADDGFVYVRAPLPAGCGFPECLIGIQARDGRPSAVRYAIPAHRSAEPPVGLEGYQWMERPGGGRWVLTADAQTGEPLF